jgi:glycosyltransferase involved in cell wall biosynthesis
MTDQHPPTVSTILTTHNRPEALRDAIESVHKQTYSPDEVIVVDDASQPSLCAEALQKAFPALPLKVLRNETSRGPGGARNQGVEVSSGEVVMFLDDDDTWEPEKVESQVRTFAQHPDAGLVYSGRLVVSHEDRSEVLYTIAPSCEGDLYPSILTGNCIGVTSSVAIRRTLFNAVGGFDADLGARVDYEMWIRCSKQAPVAHDGGLNLRYTLTSASGDQISRSPTRRHVKAVNQIMEKHADVIASHGASFERKVRADHYYYVAKMARRHSLAGALPWLLRSLLAWPRLKTLAILIPDVIMWAIRGALS